MVASVLAAMHDSGLGPSRSLRDALHITQREHADQAARPRTGSRQCNKGGTQSNPASKDPSRKMYSQQALAACNVAFCGKADFARQSS